MKYLLVYYGGGTPEGEEEQAAVMKAWTDWFTELGPAVTDPGNPFSGKVASVGAEGSVEDGPVGEAASGYSLLEAETLEDASEKAKGCPVIAGGGRVAVYETFNIM